MAEPHTPFIGTPHTRSSSTKARWTGGNRRSISPAEQLSAGPKYDDIGPKGSRSKDRHWEAGDRMRPDDPGDGERLVFDKPIGTFVEDGVDTPTNAGILHYRKQAFMRQAGQGESRPDQTNVLLSVGRALWELVTPNLRAVAVNPGDDNSVTGRFLFENEPSEDDLENTSCAETYVVADFYPDISVRFSAIKWSSLTPPSLGPGEEWIYFRKESQQDPLRTTQDRCVMRHRRLTSSHLVDNSRGHRAEIVLAATRALLGIVTPNVRGMAVTTGGAEIFGLFFFEECPTEEEHKDVLRAQTRMETDFPMFRVSCRAIWWPPPDPLVLMDGEAWVYPRKEN